MSGGGPHALACAALLPERCAAAATIAGAARATSRISNSERGWARATSRSSAPRSRAARTLTPLLEAQAAGLLEISPDQIVESMAPFLSEVDAAALTGGLAEHLMGMFRGGLINGVDGWVDDDLAFVKPWGFDVGAIAVPALIWQGVQDEMVPGAHGHWLREHVAGAEGGVLDGEGHLTLFVNRVGEIQEWLLERLR